MKIKGLNQMFPSEEKRYRFIAKCALTFGVRLDELSTILEIDKDELYRKVQIYYPEKRTSLDLLFKHGMKKQSQAKGKFIIYCDKLYLACKKNDKQSIKELLEILNDSKAMEVKLKHERFNEILKDSDIITILLFQIKYMMSPTIVGEFFGIDRTGYSNRVRKLEDKYPELVSDFNYLCDFYNKYHNKTERGL